MQLWCDKYRPQCFNDFQFHHEEAERVKRLISNENFPHLLLYGIAGSGKHTILKALLLELFGDASKKLRIVSKLIESPSGKKLPQSYVSSNFHIEVNPSEHGFYDRVIVQDLIKETATTATLSKEFPFKIIVIEEADRLTREAQQSLRRTMEKYVSTCRIILIAERSSKIIPALKSRCLMIRIPAADGKQIMKTLKNISAAENFQISENTLAKIIENSDNDLRRAILLLQVNANKRELLSSNTETKTSKKSSPDDNSFDVYQFQWQRKIQELAKDMVNQQSVQQVSKLRERLFDLQTHLIPNDIVLRTLTKRLLELCLDDDMKSNLLKIAADIDYRLANGSKPVMHLELFCVKFMMVYRCTVEKIAFDLDEPMDLD